MNEEKEISAVSTTKPKLSKSWSEISSHTPSYTGGKVTICNTKGTKNLYGYSNESIHEGDNAKDHEEKKIPFLIAPCGGDLTIIDMICGVKIRSIREGCTSAVGGDQTDGDDQSMDNDAIIAYALSPNDCDLIAAGRNNILRHYDISGSPSYSYLGVDGKGPAKVRKVLGKSGHELPISNIEFHCSGIFFATGSIDGNVKVWDLRGGYATHSFRYHAPGYTIGSRGGLRGSVSSLAWCPDITKLWLGVGRDDGTVRIHDLRVENEDSDNIIEMTDHVGVITSMLWAKSKGANDFDTFFSCGRDEVINTWRIETTSKVLSNSAARSKKKKREQHGEALDAKQLIYRRAQTLPVYENVEALLLLPQFYRYHNNGDNAIVGKGDIVLASAGSNGVVRIWKTIQKQDSKSIISGLVGVAEQGAQSAFGDKRGGYSGLLLSTSKHQLETQEADNSIYKYDEIIAIDVEHNFSFLDLGSSNKKSTKASLLDINRTIVGHNDEILDLKIIPTTNVDNDNANASLQNRKVAVATNSSQIRIFDLASYSCDVLNGHTDTVLTMDVSPCGKFLATSGKDKSTRVWQLSTNTCVAIATGHMEAIGATALSKKIGKYDVCGKAAMNGAGSFLVTASKDKTLKRWNLPGTSFFDKHVLSEGESEISLGVACSVRAHEKDINIVSVAPNDSLVASGSLDKLVKIWDSSDFTLKGVLTGHKRGVWDCQFSAHDRVIATCSGDKTIKLWSLMDFTCVRTFQGHAAGTFRVNFLCAGLQLVSCDGEGIIRVTDIRSSECVLSLDAHEDKIWALDLSSDGQLLVTGAADSTLKVFRDTTAELDLQNRQVEEKNILMEQRLANHLRFKEFEEALDLALEMGKPRQTLKVLSAIIENDIANGCSNVMTLQKHAKSWDSSRITQLLTYCREWNTRARNCQVSMLTVKAIFTSKAADELAFIDGLQDILEGILPYAERHFDRVDKLCMNSYLVDFILTSMGDVREDNVDEYQRWEKSSKYVLPPTVIDGRIQIGGQTLTGTGIDRKQSISSDEEVLSLECSSDGSVVTDDSSVGSLN